MPITYHTNKPITAEQLVDLFHRSGLGQRRPVDDMHRMENMVKHANLILTAWDGDKLVGVARSLTDFSFCCYLADLGVDQDYQRQGIGKELIRQTREIIGLETMLLLLSAPDAMPYYPHVGFEKVENAWKIPRQR